jgi:hypothetical protein
MFAACSVRSLHKLSESLRLTKIGTCNTLLRPSKVRKAGAVTKCKCLLSPRADRDRAWDSMIPGCSRLSCAGRRSRKTVTTAASSASLSQWVPARPRDFEASEARLGCRLRLGPAALDHKIRIVVFSHRFGDGIPVHTLRLTESDSSLRFRVPIPQAEFCFMLT